MDLTLRCVNKKPDASNQWIELGPSFSETIMYGTEWVDVLPSHTRWAWGL